jgi:hypothetical protein
MAEVYEASTPPAQDAPKLIFSGTQRNMAVGFAMFIAAALAFSMDLTHTFFANATAWTFVLWGALFVYVGLMDIYQTYEVTDAGLVIRNPMRPWAATKVFDWDHLYRLDLVVKRIDAQIEDTEMQVYFTPEGEIAIEREDRAYDPQLAQLIIDRAGLKPTDASNPKDLTQLPKGKTTHIWNKSGRIAAT